MYDHLLNYYSAGGPERAGGILKDGTVVEFTNVAEDPSQGFDVPLEDLERVDGFEVARWHTHPGASANLSVGDYASFTNWPALIHIILGNDGVRVYKVVNGRVVNA